MQKRISIYFSVSLAALLSLMLTGCSDRMRMARHERRADKYFAEGDFPKAEIEYLTTLRFKPDNAHAYIRLGSLYYQQGRFSRAFAFLAKATQLASNDVDVHVKLGEIYLGGQQMTQAMQQANIALERSPTNSEAPLIFAESAISRQDVTNARARLGKLTQQIGVTAPVELALGVLDIKSGDMKTAEASIKRALDLDPKSSSAYFGLGNLYIAQDNLKEADAALKKGAELAPIRSTRRLSYAIFKIKSGQLDEGKQLLAGISKEAPDYIPAWIQQAEIALAEKRYDDCSTLLDQALGRDTDNFEALVVRARLRIAQGQPDKLEAELEHAASVYTSSPQIQYYLAIAYSLNKDTTKAAASLDKALRLNPDFPEAILALAELNIDRGNDSPAIAALTQLVKQHPHIAEAHVLLAKAYLDQKNPDQAIAVCSHMAELFPTNAEVPFLTGRVLMLSKKFPEARRAFEHALALSPHMLLAVEQLVNLDLDERQFEAAEKRAQVEAVQQPKLALPQLLLAKTYLARAAADSVVQAAKADGATELSNVASAQSDLKHAETALLKAIDLAPESPVAYFTLAQLYVGAGKPQQALDLLKQLVSKTDNVSAYLQIGMIHDGLKQYSEARDAYEKTLAINPNFTTALNNLAYLYSEKLGDLDQAYSLAQKAYDLQPSDPSSEDTLGWIMYRKGDYARALGLLQESATKISNQPEILFHLGLARYMSGDESGARAALQEAAAFKRDFPGKSEIAGRLTLLAIDPETADAKTLADLEKRLVNEPNDPIVAIRVASIYERNGDLNRAASAYEQVLKNNPSPQIMGKLARVYDQLKDRQKAIEMAKKAHSLAPDDGSISLILGRLLFQTGDYNWALSLLQDASRKMPSRTELSYDVSWASYAVGQINAAEMAMQAAQPALSGANLEDAKRFLGLVAATKTPSGVLAAATQASQILSGDPGYVPAIMILAMQQEQSGNPDEAAKSYEKVIARYSDFVPAIRNLAILYANQGGSHDQRAFELAGRAHTSLPDDANLTRALGVLSYRRGDYTRAAQLLGESAQKVNNDAELLYYLGMANFQLKNKPESKNALAQALQLNLQAKLAADARKALEQLK